MHALVGMAVGLLIGTWTAALGGTLPHAWMSNVAVLGVGGLLMVSTRSSPARPARRAAWLFGGLTFLVGQALFVPPPAPRPVPRGLARLEGTLVRTRHGDGPSGLLRVHAGARLDPALPYPAAAELWIRGLEGAPGTRVRLMARARPRTRFENPTPHPRWPAHAAPDGFGTLVGEAESLRPAPFFERTLERIRGRVRRHLRESLSERPAGLARALLLGEAGAVAAADRNAVRDAGMSHVLAVSGLHVALLAGLMVALLRRALERVPWIGRRVVPGRVAAAMGVPLALGYAALVGDAPSAWRAALTASIAWTLTALGRRPDPRSLTAGAVLLMAAVRPGDLGRPGFALSIVATAAIVTGLERDSNWVAAGLRVTGRTMLATAPLVLWMFGGVPAVGLLANLVAVPLAAVALLPLCALHVALAPSGLGLAPLIEPVAEAFLSTTEVLAAVSWGRALPPLSVAQGAIVLAAALAMLASRRWRTRLWVLAATGLALAAAEWHLVATEQPEGVLRATFLDVGQGDAALVDLPDGRLMVVDAGGAPNGGPDPGLEVLVPLLEARRRKRIDVLVLSHPHPDHYGGMAALLERFEVGEIWDSGQAERETPESGVARLIRDAGVVVQTPPTLCRGPRAFGAAIVRTLAPCPDIDVGWGPNENSLVLEVTLAERRILLTGDAEAHAEQTLLEGRTLRTVDVLKVAHHGSRTSTGEAFLGRVRPRVSIASMGRDNRYGHPHAEVWSRLSRSVPCALRTDRHGGVTVTTDGHSLEVSSALPSGCAERSLTR